jgi:pimeloyl-ACP methyl ester carboxylesterase
LRALPNAVFRIFEQSGHQPFFEEPDEFMRGVHAWMNGIG